MRGRPRSVRIAYAAVDGGRDFDTEALRESDARHRTLLATVAALAGRKIDLLVFPAGYFQVHDDGGQRRLVARVTSDLNDISPRFGLIWGVDRRRGSKKRPVKRPSATGHPYFAFYRSPSGALTSMQQVSVTAKEGDKETVAKRWYDRTVVLSETDIAFLICGESWSDELLDRVAKSGCRALVVAAHRNVNLHREKTGYGKLSWHRRLGAFSRQYRLPAVLAEHSRSPGRHPYAWPAAISRSLQLKGVPDGVTLRIAEV
jgi:hypothetical protein